jgi:fluoride ion exporter CrcB/FEX
VVAKQHCHLLSHHLPTKTRAAIDISQASSDTSASNNLMNTESSENVDNRARTRPSTGPSSPATSNAGSSQPATNHAGPTSGVAQRSPLQISDHDLSENWDEFSDAFQTNIAEPGRKALHHFFYPSRQSLHQQQDNDRDTTGKEHAARSNATTSSATLPQSPQVNDYGLPLSNGQPPSTPRQTPPIELDADVMEQVRQDKAFIEDFWTTYDDIIILSLFTQIGILFRLGAAYGFRVFDSAFRKGSALFTNLPLNCFSCFIMGLLCSGESLMEIVSTRFTPPRLQHDLHQEARSLLSENTEEEDIENLPESPSAASPRWGGTPSRRRRKKTTARASGWRPQTDDFHSELREVQLLALERRIRASPCLVLFHVKKVDVDVVENYFNDGDRNKNQNRNREEKEEEKEPEDGDGERFSLDEHDLVLEESEDDPNSRNDMVVRNLPLNSQDHADGRGRQETPRRRVRLQPRNYAQIEQVDGPSTPTNDNTDSAAQALDLEQIVSNVATDVSQQISRIGRVSLADGWDVGTTPEDKTKDVMLGLRDGLCGALSSFSSWISSMVTLFRAGNIGEAFVGIVLGIQLPLVAYRFGQHVAVYLFVWRCRRETGRDERRGGYGIRLSMDEDLSEEPAPASVNQSIDSGNILDRTVDAESEAPSVRAIITALFVLSLVAQITSLNFYYEPEDRLLALSLLFSPLGVLTRWRLSKFNSWRPSFPIGTFICNISACALSGTLGSVLAGNPDPRERIALVALIAGFGGTLSSVARFIVEVLAGVDPILLRIDGAYYAMISVACGVLISFSFTASVDWADNTE